MALHPIRRVEKVYDAWQSIEDRSNKNMHAQLVAAKHIPMHRAARGRSGGYHDRIFNRPAADGTTRHA